MDTALTRLHQLILLLLVLVGLIVAMALYHPVTPARAGTAPDFRLDSTMGRQTALSEYRGHPVLLNFFATWCVTCKKELPAIARARLRHPDLRALLIDERETAREVRTFLRGLHVAQPALLDSDGAVATRYAVSAQPVTIWVSSSGRVGAVSRGPIDDWTIDARYSQLKSRQ